MPFALLALLLAAPNESAAAQPSKPGAAKEALVCRREVPVGSLIASRKICLTKSHWQKRSDDGNAPARGLIEDGAGACGQNGGVCPF